MSFMIKFDQKFNKCQNMFGQEADSARWPFCANRKGCVATLYM